jgi:AraC-like DNA-binding protein
MSVSIFFVRALVEAVERAGASRAELFARFPFDGRLLEEPKARLEVAEFERALAAAADLTGDDALSLHMAEQMGSSAMDLLAHLAAHAPTIREVVATSSQFGSLGIDGLLLAAHDEGDTFVVRCVFPRSTPLWDRMVAEFTMGGLARLARTFVGPHAVARLACFEHERPSHHREYTRIFGSRLQFGKNLTSIAFDREFADRPQIHHHAELYSLLRAEAERRLDRMATGTDAAARLHQYLLPVPPSRFPDMAKAARDLGMSERSLRRHLAAEGTSYRDVVRSALEASAGRMLRDPTRTIKETAEVLGFAHATAFVRAFKRWTGLTPGEYRRARSGR